MRHGTAGEQNSRREKLAHAAQSGSTLHFFVEALFSVSIFNNRPGRPP